MTEIPATLATSTSFAPVFPQFGQMILDLYAQTQPAEWPLVTLALLMSLIIAIFLLFAGGCMLLAPLVWCWMLVGCPLPKSMKDQI